MLWGQFFMLKQLFSNNIPAGQRVNFTASVLREFSFISKNRLKTDSQNRNRYGAGGRSTINLHEWVLPERLTLRPMTKMHRGPHECFTAFAEFPLTTSAAERSMM